jgi:putative ABC transport system permease protein
MTRAIVLLAWRNIWRNGRRTAITSLAVAFGTTAFLFVQSYLNGINAGFRENLIGSETGHARIAAREYLRLERVLPKEHLLWDYSRLARAVASLPTVRHITSRIKIRLMLSRDGMNEPCVAIGIDPDGEKNFLGLPGRMKAGRYLGASDREMIIGELLAARLGVRTGDALLAVTSDINAGTYGLEFRVAGIFATGVRAMDGNVFCISLAAAQELLDCRGAVHEILLLAADADQAPAAAAAVKKILARRGLQYLAVVTLQEHWMSRYMVLAEKIMNVIVVLLMLVAASVIANTMRMSIMERTHEIGVIQSLGLRAGALRLLIVSEAFFIGLIGAAAGCCLGAALSLVAQHAGFDVSRMLERMDAPIPFMSTILRPRLSPAFVVEAFFFGAGFAVLAAIRPAGRASRMEPAAALRSGLQVR